MKLTSTLSYKNVHSAKRLFQPFITSPAKSDSSSKVTSRSQKLMQAAGIIHQAHNGLFHLLPLGIRALKKLTALVEDCISKQLNAQQISVPSLTDAQLWNKTGRKEVAGVELFTLTDRHNKQFVLAPTHEESIANLIATIPLISHRDLPLLLYQITNKYRDEMRPRFGLIRSKEFLMKDLYSFDKNKEDAIDTYAKVCNTYEIILNRIGVDYVKVVGDTGLMGGSFSHEYHYVADIGDDTLSICNKCHSSWNSDIHKDEGSNEKQICHECGSIKLKQHKGIEVGHAFLLGTKYSTALNALFNSDKQKREHLVMGSYGLGLTRMVAAAIEVLSTPNEIRWPAVFAPYSVVIITPKEGSKEAAMVDNLGIDLYTTLQTIKGLSDDILLDDRTHLTIGRRLTEAKLTGYPNIIVIGKSAATLQTPHYELHNLNNDTVIEITFNELIEQIKRNCNSEITSDNCLSRNLQRDVIVV